MENIRNLAKPEREEEILKELIYFIQCDIEAQSASEKEKTEAQS